ncbi:hypothetical protein [Alishewanella sp. HH-ZS]|uniref:hypothetical protein n=1 Tax=Alishewanella sp. HH-ZS TaxID=1856684 RepID=UPI0021010E26|nr:hypothetical protein [Alishewanella sp. HH-ZS]
MPDIEQARAQINQSRALIKASSLGAGPALGAGIGAKTPSAKAYAGAEASMIVRNGPNGPENLVTLAAGASYESGSVSAKAQLFKIEETSDSSSGVPKTTSLKREGPDLNIELSAGPATVSTDNTVEVQATVLFFRATLTVDMDILKEELK